MKDTTNDKDMDVSFIDPEKEILCYKNQYIVVDTKTDFIYIGKLIKISNAYITLGDVDVHDSRETPTLKEKYILDARKYGVRQNRKLVHVRINEVISISLLEDIIEY